MWSAVAQSGRCSRRTWRRSRTSRSGPTTWRRSTSTRSTVTGSASPAQARSSAGRARRQTRRSYPPAISASSRRRRCTPTPAIRATAHAFADGCVATVQNGIGNEEVLAAHVERVIRGTTFPAGKITAPGRRAVGRQGRHDVRAVRGAAGAVRRGRAPRRGVHARRHADEGGRGRARPAVAQGDLQRRHEPARGADRPDPRPGLRTAAAARGSRPSSSTRARPSPRPRESSWTPTPRN